MTQSPKQRVMDIARRLLRLGKSATLLTQTRHNANTAVARVDAIEHSLRDLFVLLHDSSTQTDAQLKDTAACYDEIKATLHGQERAIWGQEASLAAFSKTLAVQAEAIEAARRSYDHKISALSATIDTIVRMTAARSPASDAPPAIMPDAPESVVLQSFYVALEAKFRGSTQDIKNRQTIYLPDIEHVIAQSDSKVVLDIGCGRGEWLSVLRERGIEGIGVDTNEGQLSDSRRDGLAVWNGDAFAYLRDQKEGAFAAVTAFHIFEHLPFPVLAQWLVEIRRVLVPGGILIAETPNPDNLIVGANKFHLDPTHVKPLPSGILGLLCETVGLKVHDVRPLHPSGHLDQALKDLPEREALLLYGAQDYGLIAARPARETF